MNKKYTLTLLLFLLLSSVVTHKMLATHFEGGALFYERLGPGSLPNSSRYKIKLVLYRDPLGIDLPGNVVIMVRAHVRQPLTVSGVKGSLINADYIDNYITNPFIRDFQISNQTGFTSGVVNRVLDTLTVRSGSLGASQNRNSDITSAMFSTLTGYEFLPSGAISGYPTGNMLRNGFGYVQMDTKTDNTESVNTCTSPITRSITIGTYIRVVDLPNVPGGYHLYYDDYARNRAIRNIYPVSTSPTFATDPSPNNVGYAVYARIPDYAVWDNDPLSYRTLSQAYASVGLTTALGIGIAHTLSGFNQFISTATANPNFNGTTAGIIRRMNNASPQYTYSPPTFICSTSLALIEGNNDPNISGFHNAASDMDGDELEYSITTPKMGIYNHSNILINGVVTPVDFQTEQGYRYGGGTDDREYPFVDQWKLGNGVNVNGTIFNNDDYLFPTFPYTNNPYPFNVNLPTFNNVAFAPGFSEEYPIGIITTTSAIPGITVGSGSTYTIPGIIVRPDDGFTIYNPPSAGRLVAAVRVREFRNITIGGIVRKAFLGEIQRDFQYTVFNCPLPSQARIRNGNTCFRPLITPVNLQYFALDPARDQTSSWFWDFGIDRYTVVGGNLRRVDPAGNLVPLTNTLGGASLRAYTSTLSSTNFFYTTPGTYFVKLVVQLDNDRIRRTSCSDSVFIPINVSSVRAGYTVTGGPICVQSNVNFNPFVTASGVSNGFSTTSGNSLYTNPATNPIPMVTTVSGTVSGIGHAYWMQPDGTRQRIPPPPAQPSRIVRVTYNFGNGVTQEFTLTGSNVYVPVGGLKPGVTVTGFLGPYSLPGVVYRYPSPSPAGGFNTSLKLENQFGCIDSLVRNITVVQERPSAVITSPLICQNVQQTTVSGFVTIATVGGIWSGGSGTYITSATMTGVATVSGTTPGLALTLVYRPTASELSTAGNTIPLVLSTTGNGVCPVGVSTGTGITVSRRPIVNAGPNALLCRNNPTYRLNGSVIVASVPGSLATVVGTGIWTTNGTGTFTSTGVNTSTGLNDTYVFSNADVLAGAVTLTLTSTNNGICNPERSTITLTLSPPGTEPMANAGADMTVCANNGVITLSGTVTNSGLGGVWSFSSPLSGSFTGPLVNTSIAGPNAFRVTRVYTLSPADTLLTELEFVLSTNLPSGSTCNVVRDTVRYQVLRSPELFVSIRSANTVEPRVTCANNPGFTITGTVLGAGGLFTNIGTGITNLVSSSLGMNGGRQQFIATYTYQPSASELSLFLNYMLDAADNIPLSITSTNNNGCVAVSFNSNLGVKAPPRVVIGRNPGSVQVGATDTLCKNNPNYSLGLVIGAFFVSLNSESETAWFTNGGGTFVPSASGSYSTTYLASLPADTLAGSVRIIASGNRINEGCLPVYDTLTIVYSNIPVVNPGTNQTICENNPRVQLNGSVGVPASGGIWGRSGTGLFQSTSGTTSTLLNDVYNGSLTDVSNGSVVLSLTTTGARIGSGHGQCLPVSRSITVNFSPVPVINFGPVPASNENNPAVNLTATVVGANVTPSTSAIWTGGTGTYLPNNHSFVYNPVGPVVTGFVNYTPSPAEIAAQVANLIVSVSGASNCNPFDATLPVTIFPRPTVRIFPRGSVCANNATIALAYSFSGAAGVTWSGGENIVTPLPGNTAQYVPSTNEINQGFVKLYLTTNGEFNNALPERDSITVNITPAPRAITVGNLVVCGNAPVINFPGSVTGAFGAVWTTTGSGTFVGSALTTPRVSTTIPGGNTSINYIPSAADRASALPIPFRMITVGNGNCNAVFDILNLSFQPAPVSNAGPDRAVCVNDFPVVLNASGSVGSWSSSRPGGIFGSTGNGTSTSLSDTYTPTTVPGLITMSWTTSTATGCPPVTSSFVLTVVPAPTVSITILPSETICGLGGRANLIANITGATGGTWRSSGTGVFTSTGTQIGNNPIDTYVPSAADVLAGSVMLTFTGSGTSPCTPVSATRRLYITPAITANAGPDLEFCSTQSVISLSGQVLANGSVSGVLNGSWTKVATVGGVFIGPSNVKNAVFQPTTADKTVLPRSIMLVFTPNASGACAAPPSDTVVYRFRLAPTLTISSSINELCSDAVSIPLTSTVVGASGIVWSTTGAGGAAGFSVDNTSPSVNYALSGSDRTASSIQFIAFTNGAGVCSNVSSNLVTVSVTSKPIISMGSDLSVCSNVEDVTLTGVNMTLVGANVPFVQWKSPTGGVFTVTSATTTPGINYIRTNNVGAFSVYKRTPTDLANGLVTLLVTVSGPGSCGMQFGAKNITFFPAPVISIGAPSETYCSDVPLITLTATVLNSTHGLWSALGTNVGTFTGNGRTATFVPSAAARLTTGIGFNFISTFTGCLVEDENKTILFTPKPVVSFAGVAPTVCGDNFNVTLAGYSSTGALQWSDGAFSGVFSPSASNYPNITYGANFADVQNAINTNSLIQITITSDNNGVCTPVSTTTGIKFVAPPVISILGADLYCSNVNQFNITATAINAGSVSVLGYRWFTSANNTTFPGAAGTFVGAGGITSTLASETYRPGELERNTSTIITLSTTGVTNQCANVSVSKTINYQPAPFIGTLPNRVVCSNNSELPLTLNPQNTVRMDMLSSSQTQPPFAQGVFSNPVFDVSAPDNNTLPFTTSYFPGAFDIANGTVTITASAIGSGVCASPAVNSSFVLSITSSPTVTLTGPSSICADVTTVQLSAQLGLAGTGISWGNGTHVGTSSGAFFPNSFVTTVIYNLSALDLASTSIQFNATTTGNGNCNAVVQSLPLPIVARPTISGGLDRFLCSTNNNITLTYAGSNFSLAVWTTSGNGNFGVPFEDTQANPNPDFVTYNFGTLDYALGRVTFQVKTLDHNTLCGQAFDFVNVTLVSPPVIDAGVGGNFCESVANVTLSGSIIGSESYTYQWSTDKYIGVGGEFLNSVNDFATDPKTYSGSAVEVFSLGNIDRIENLIKFDFTVTNTGICAGVYRDSVYTKIQKLTTATIFGDNLKVCADANRIFLDARIFDSYEPGNHAIIPQWSGINSAGRVSQNSEFIPNINQTFTRVDRDTDVRMEYFFPLVDRTTTGVTFTLSTVGVSLCPPTSVSKTVTVTSAPTVSVSVAGLNIACTNNPLVTVLGYSSTRQGSWRTNTAGSNRGVFLSVQTVAGDIVRAVYSVSGFEFTNNLVTLLFTSEGNDLCQPVSTTIGIILKQAPEVDAGIDGTACNLNNISLTGIIIPSVTGTNYTWAVQTIVGTVTGVLSPTLYSSIITIDGGGGVTSSLQRIATYFDPTDNVDDGSVTFRFTATEPGCAPVFDDVNFTITSSITLNAGLLPTSICGSDVVRLNPPASSAQGVWSTSGTGYFQSTGNNQSTVMNDVYVPGSGETGQVIFALLSIPGTQCLSNTGGTTTSAILTPGLRVDAGVSQQISVCFNVDPPLLGTISGTSKARWYTSGTGNFQSNIDLGLTSNFTTTLTGTASGSNFLFSDVYRASDDDKIGGQVIIGLETVIDENTNCVTVQRDTLRVFYVREPFAQAAGSQRFVCANTALSDGVSVTGFVTFTHPNTKIQTLPNFNAARWVVFTAAGIGSSVMANPLTSPGYFMSAVTPPLNAQGVTESQLTVAGLGDFEFTASTVPGTSLSFNDVYMPSPQDVALDANGNPANYKLILALIAGNVTIPSINTGLNNELVKCNDIIDILTVNFTPAPLASITSGLTDISVCADQDVVTISGTTAGITLGHIWSTTGSGGIAPGILNTYNISYSLSASERDVSVPTPLFFVMSATGLDGCKPETSSVVTVTVNPRPGISAGLPQTVCADLPSLTINGFNTVTVAGALPTAFQWFSSGFGGVTVPGASGTIAQTVGSINMPIGYVFSEQDRQNGSVEFLLSTTGPAGCKPLTSSVNVTINPRPSITPQPDLTLCSDNRSIPLSITMQNISDVQWVVYTRNRGSMVLTANPNAGALVSGVTTVTNGTLSGGAFANVEYRPSASVQNDVDLVVLSVTSLAYIPNTANPPCEPVGAQIRINFTERPFLSVLSSAQVCATEREIPLTASITGALGAIWNTTSDGLFLATNSPTLAQLIAGSTYQLGASDTNITNVRNVVIRLTATDVGTCIDTYTISTTVGIIPKPRLDAGGNQNICADNTVLTLPDPATLITATGIPGPISAIWIPLGTGTLTGNNYARSTADSIAGAVSFVLTVSGSAAPCQPIRDFKTIRFDTPPRVLISAGLDQILCANTRSIGLNGFVQNATNQGWYATKPALPATQRFHTLVTSLAGRGRFRASNSELAAVNNTVLGAFYFPSVEDILGTNPDNLFQEIIITLSVNGTGMCANSVYQDDVKYIFAPLPDISVTGTPFICVNDDRPITLTAYFFNTIAGAGLWGTTGKGSFVPSGVTHPNSVAGVGIYGGNEYYLDAEDRLQKGITLELRPQNMLYGCTEAYIRPLHTLEIIPKPVVGALTDIRVCEDVSSVNIPQTLVTGIQSGQWRSTGSGVFTSVIPNTNPGANFVVTTASGNRFIPSESYIPSLEDTLGENRFVYLWLKSTQQDFNCPADSARLTVRFDKIPKVTVGLDQSVCANDGVVSLTGAVKYHDSGFWTVLAPAGGGVFAPSSTVSGSSTVRYTLSQADRGRSEVQFVLQSVRGSTNQCAAVSSNPVSVFIQQPPVATFTNPSVCTINGIQLTGRTTFANSVEWKTSGTGVFSPSVFDSTAKYYPSQQDIDNGNVKITLLAYGRSVCGPDSASSNLRLKANPFPVADAGRDEIICRFDAFKLAPASFSNNNSYNWFTVVQNGSVKELVTVGGENQSVVMVNVSSDTLFVLQVVNELGCLASDSINIKALTLPALNLTPYVCFETDLVLPFNQQTPIIKTEGSYQWYRGNTILAGETSKDRLRAIVPDTYVLEYTEFNCSIYDTTLVRPLPIADTRGRVFCEGASAVIFPNILSIDGVNINTYTYNWALPYNVSMNGFNLLLPPQQFRDRYLNRTYTITETRDSAKYLVLVTDTTFGLSCELYDTVQVKTHPVPDMTLRNVTACDNDVVTLDARPSNLETPKTFFYPPVDRQFKGDTINATYVWTSVPDPAIRFNPRIKITRDNDPGNGFYRAVFTIGECVAVDTSLINFNRSPIVDNLSEVGYCIDSKEGIVLDAGGSADSLSYLWLASGNTRKTELVYDTLMYYVKISNAVGCSTIDSIKVDPNCIPVVFLPEGIMPDGPDEKNRYFQLFGKYFKDIKLTVFNRWGEVVLYTEDPSFLWNGERNGVKLPMGIYPWQIEYRSIYGKYNNTVYRQRGSLTIVR